VHGERRSQHQKIENHLFREPSQLIADARDMTEVSLMMLVGIVLLLLGLVLAVPILWVVGLILVLVGAVLWVAGSAGHAVAGRRHYW
jgi:fatty acid desaturase